MRTSPPTRAGALAVAAFLLAAGSPARAADTAMPENPFFTESPLPYHLPPFDRIKDSDYASLPSSAAWPTS